MNKERDLEQMFTTKGLFGMSSKCQKEACEQVTQNSQKLAKLSLNRTSVHFTTLRQCRDIVGLREQAFTLRHYDTTL